MAGIPDSRKGRCFLSGQFSNVVFDAREPKNRAQMVFARPRLVEAIGFARKSFKTISRAFLVQKIWKLTSGSGFIVLPIRTSRRSNQATGNEKRLFPQRFVRKSNKCLPVATRLVDVNKE